MKFVRVFHARLGLWLACRENTGLCKGLCREQRGGTENSCTSFQNMKDDELSIILFYNNCVLKNMNYFDYERLSSQKNS